MSSPKPPRWWSERLHRGAAAERAATEEAQASAELDEPDTGGAHTARAPLVKPPLGLIPRLIARDIRATAVRDAIARYEAVGYPVPPQWTDELAELTAPPVDVEAAVQAGMAVFDWDAYPDPVGGGEPAAEAAEASIRAAITALTGSES